MPILTVIVAALPVLFYGQIVIGVRGLRMRVPALIDVDPAVLRADVAAALAAGAAPLEAIGFTRVAVLTGFNDGTAAGVRAVAVLGGPVAGDRASVIVVEGATGLRTVRNFCTSWADHSEVDTTENEMPRSLETPPGSHVVRVGPQRDAAAFYALHRRVVARLAPERGPGVVVPRAELPAHFAAGIRRCYDREVTAGRYWNRGLGQFGPTWRGAVATAWRFLPGVRDVDRALERRAVGRLIASLG